MQQWFAELQRVNRNFLQAAKEASAAEWLHRSTVEKYADPAHFIFELVQNADDQRSRKVEFKLLGDRVEFRHWGDPFLPENVRRITRFGDSDKLGVGHKIGRFGVGFKSVFAFTDRPEIYCKMEDVPFAFAIEELTIPVLLSPDPNQQDNTLFVLPLRSEAERGGQSRVVDEVAECIRQAGPEMLMFLENVEELTWSDSVTGLGERFGCTRHDSGVVSLERKSYSKSESVASDQSTSYRVFRRDIHLPDGNNSYTAVAFLLDSDGNAVPEQAPPRLWVFFETEEQTGLRFRIHGPFELTDNRANIKRNHAFNNSLVGTVSEVVAYGLLTLRDERRLSRETLSALPIPSDDLSHTWTVVAEAIWHLLRSDSILPRESGGYAPAATLLQGPGILKAVIDDKDLFGDRVFNSTGALLPVLHTL